MKKVFIIPLLFYITLPLMAQSSPETDVLAALFSPDRSEYASLFDEQFLAQVPEQSLKEIIQSYLSKLGLYKNATGEKGSYTLLFEKGKTTCQIGLTAQGRIGGLWLGPMSLFDDTPEKIKADFLALDGEVSLCVVKNGMPVFTIDEDAPLAVGSAFKLYILKALQDKIAQGKARWEDAIPLRKEWMSSGGGILENWPIGSPITLHSLASLMISMSDNTATDQLLFHLGRDTVEAVAPGRLRPFLSTAEMFKLKWTGEGKRAASYIASDIAGRRKLLTSLESVSLKDMSAFSGPAFIKDIEWFISTEELCQVITELKDLTLLSINPGLVDKKNWELVGFKGGSEPGVLNFTQVLRKTASSPVYAVSATINHETKEVNLKVFAELVTRLIGLIEKEAI